MGAPWGSERSVSLLLEQNKEKIDAVREILGDELPKDDEDVYKYDDIWLLRFTLTHPIPEEAASSASRTLEWRKENAELLKAARDNTPPPYGDVIQKYMVADHHKPSKHGEPFYIVRAGVSNVEAIMDSVDQEHMVNYILYRKEQSHLECDRETRKQGEIIKLITVNDLNHVSLIVGQEKRFRACLGRAAKLSEEFYPQLLERAVLLNLPVFVNVLLGLFKPMMPKRMLEKLSICPGRTTSEDVSRCPFMSERVHKEDLPSFLGGSCKCAEDGGCISGVANDTSSFRPKDGDDGLAKQTVAARTKHEACKQVPAGYGCRYSFVVEPPHGLEFGIVLRQEGGGEIDVLKAAKYKPDEGAKHEGTLKVPGKGTLVATWDNSSSLVNSKTIRYAFEVFPHDQEGS